MDGTRNERARAGARHLLAKSRPCPMILRELSMDYIREAERIENEGVTRVESSEQISAGLDAIARYFFARALRNAK
jgi:hypothetical protein